MRTETYPFVLLALELYKQIEVAVLPPSCVGYKPVLEFSNSPSSLLSSTFHGYVRVKCKNRKTYL